MKEIAKQVQLKTQIKQVPTMIVNGEVQQYSEIPITVAVCSECNNIVASFPEGVSRSELYKELSNAENIEMIAKSFPTYCQHCGQKLNFTFESIIEVI